MSTIENAKKVMGWLNPNARAACRNCAKVQEEKNVPAYARAPMRCGLGGFITPPLAVCDKYEPKPLLCGGVPK